METSLRNRLTYGPLMMAGMVLLLVLDHYAQRWTHTWAAEQFGMASGFGGIGLFLILLLILPLATRELAVLFTAEQVRPFRSIAAAGSFALICHAFLTQIPAFQRIAASTLAFIIVFIPLLAALRRASRKRTQEAITAMAGTILSTLYLGGLAWFLMAIRVKRGGGPDVFLGSDFKGSTGVILMILLIVKSTDIGAYFGGRALGKHKLIPWLSPGKTWEGLAIGLLVSGSVGIVFSLFGVPSHNWIKGAILGVVLGGIGQLGDLLESLMKRDADVKDSGKLIPGFGGVLDVIDSPLLAAPFAYLLLSLM